MPCASTEDSTVRGTSTGQCACWTRPTSANALSKKAVKSFGPTVGAEGTLGVVTAAALRLAPAIAGHATAWVGLSDPAAGLALETLRRGGIVIEINPDSTDLTRMATFSLRETASRGLEMLMNEG